MNNEMEEKAITEEKKREEEEKRRKEAEEKTVEEICNAAKATNVFWISEKDMHLFKFASYEWTETSKSTNAPMMKVTIKYNNVRLDQVIDMCHRTVFEDCRNNIRPHPNSPNRQKAWKVFVEEQDAHYRTNPITRGKGIVENVLDSRSQSEKLADLIEGLSAEEAEQALELFEKKGLL